MVMTNRIGQMLLSGLLLVMVTACGSKEVILPGERSAILAVETLPEIDLAAASEGAQMGEVLPNIIYSQSGLMASHRGGHLALEWPLQRAWSVSIGVDTDLGTLMASPIANQVSVFGVTPDAQLTAVNLNDGSIRWRMEIEPRADKTQPAVSGGLALENDQIFAHAGGKMLVSLNADDGAVLWDRRFDLPLMGGPTAIDGRVAVTDIDGRLFVLSASDGAVLWSRVGNPESTRVLGASSPAIHNGELVLTGNDAELSVLTLDRGELLWGDDLSVRTPRTALDNINSIVAHPVYDGNMVFVGSMSGRFAAYNTQTGSQSWEIGVATHQQPWVAGKTVFAVSAKGRVYAIRRQDGSIRWISALPGAVPLNLTVSDDAMRYVGPIAAGGRIIVIDQNGKGLFLDPDTGAILDSQAFGAAQSGAPIIVSGTLIILDDRGRLSAYR
jgi:outer membrane protein assembly factor BamB